MGERRGTGPTAETETKRIGRELELIQQVAEGMRAVMSGEGRVSTASAEKLAELSEGAKLMKDGLLPFQAAFNNKALVARAIRIADEIMYAPGVTARLVPIIVASVESIIEHIRENPKNLSLPLKLLAFTKMNLTIQAEEDTSAQRRIGKIRQMTTEALPDFEVYFSDANPAEDGELVERFFALSALITLVDLNREGGEWLKRMYPKLLASILMSDTYTNVPKPVEGDPIALAFMSHEKMMHALKEGTARRELLRRFFARYTREPSMLSAAMADVFTEIGMPEDYLAAGVDGRGMLIGLDECVPGEDEEGRPVALEILIDQLETIRALERERPGAAAVLFKAFGIRFFSRYPLELLIKQYDNRDVDMPFGIITTGIWDSNQAFFDREETHDLYLKLDKQLSTSGHGIRFIEANGNEEFERHMRFMKEAYGEGNKASFLFMRAHAHKWSLALGPSESSGYLLHSHLEGRNYAQYADVFEPGFTSIFEGCSIARGTESIVGEWSRTFPDGLVYGPPGMSTSSIDIDIEARDGKLAFDIGYVVNNQAKWAAPNTFKNGKRYKA